MTFKSKNFTWWHNRMMLVLVVSTVLTAVLVKSGLVITTHIPPGGITDPVCYVTGGLLSPDGFFRQIKCAHFFGSGVASYLLNRGFYFVHPGGPVLGFIRLGLEILAAVPLAWMLGRVGNKLSNSLS